MVSSLQVLGLKVDYKGETEYFKQNAAKLLTYLTSNHKNMRPELKICIFAIKVWLTLFSDTLYTCTLHNYTSQMLIMGDMS